jgi:hypothetical protein
MADSNRGAARYTTHYTRQEIDAYLEAVIDHGMKATDAMRKALAGELKAGIAPFGRKAKSGKVVFGYSISKIYGEAYIARNPALQAEDTRNITQALHDANKRDAKALAESDTATMAERSKAARDLAESYKALASIQPRENTRGKTPASDREQENHGAEPQREDTTLAELDAIAEAMSHNATGGTQRQDEARGPVHSAAR